MDSDYLPFKRKICSDLDFIKKNKKILDKTERFDDSQQLS